MSVVKIADQDARNNALNTDLSFIVQAPAGSGKTGLLTQRFIALLARVDAPEEITAITFTIKAAAEMRNRILQVLERAVNENEPDDAYERQSWQLAQKALARDKEKGWHLLENPSRLRIQTIDSLCASLSRQMPVLSRFGSVPAITKDANALYAEAASNAIAELDGDNEWSVAIEHLIKHLDNQQDKVQALIVTMLAKRDQWLRHIIHSDNPDLERKNLEDAMCSIIEEHLIALSKSLPEHCKLKLLELAAFASSHLSTDSQSTIAGLDNASLPTTGVDELQRWEGISELLLTKTKNSKTGKCWRARVTKKEGFPAQGDGKDKDEKTLFKNKKAEILELIGSLSEESKLHEQLFLLRNLPEKEYTDEEWATLQALLKVLRLAVINLELVFKMQGKVDFSALALAALHALGADESPTDLALALDYRIQHLLVDEFQDTAFNQYDLLKKLTTGWQPGDGHTLFCVGDPMQSIYGFREANVGLFLDAKEKGIGHVNLNFLNLTVNFRSQSGIVDWINQSFPVVLPALDNASKGAVSYASSTSFHPNLAGDAVTVYPSLTRDDTAEAKQVISIIQQAKTDNPNGTIAIIVRSRSHLVQIIEALKNAELPYQAVEIEKLAHRPIVQDLLALTRALNHHADRIAWLSILRAPYCGLTLDDLHVLAGDDLKSTIVDLLRQQQRIELMSDDGRIRLARVLPVLEAAIAQQERSTQRNRVEGTWLSLGGPACAKNKTDLKDVEVYFQLLEEITNESSELDLQKLSDQVDMMFALPDVEADGKLQLLTMHKAKGLEFDTVILPALGRTPPSDQSRLLHWFELGFELGLETDQKDSNSCLVLAPISPLGEKTNKTVEYLKLLDNEKRHYEDGRLLYVATTRAKKRLHLLGHTTLKENKKEVTLELAEPDKRSLLGSLWLAVKSNYQTSFDASEFNTREFDIGDYDANGVRAANHERNDSVELSATRTRLVSDWVLPSAPEAINLVNTIKEKEIGEQIEFSWSGETARHIGTVVHRFLQRIGEMGVENVTLDTITRYRSIARTMMLRLGVSNDHIDSALDRMNTALLATINGEKGKWALSNKHQRASCEYAISTIQHGYGQSSYVRHMIIDRTFIDEHGTRWVIDYKTGVHTGSDLDEYLDREQERYSQQLTHYADAIRKIEDNPIRLALYFPMMEGWREWSA